MHTRTIISPVLALMTVAAYGQVFSAADRAAVRTVWTDKVRYEAKPPPYADNRGAWQVRLTSEGSRWLYDFNRLIGVGKAAKGATPVASEQESEDWSEWVSRRIAADRREAERQASARNAGRTIAEALDYGSVAGLVEDGSGVLAHEFGESREPMPESLQEHIGKPPPLAAAVKPSLHRIVFGNEPSIDLVDQAPVPANYAFFRNAQGVVSGGTPVRSMSDEDAKAIQKASGLDEGTWRVVRAVSQLEGGFDSINTYDTGFVSAGFIQFACGKGGSGSLGKVLLRVKENDRKAFASDFERFGITVNEKGVLVVCEPDSGKVREGAAAAKAIMDEPRLAAVFVRAGRRSVAFRVAQLQIAKERYFPSEDLVVTTLGDESVSIRIGDLFKSEAGLATLMDRKVHTGRLETLPAVIAKVVEANGCQSVEELAAVEDQLVAGMKYRRDFFKDASLEQPVATTRGATDLASRGGLNRAKPKAKPRVAPKKP